MHECDTGIAEARKTVSGIERDVAGADAKRANLQENIRVRQYARQIEETQKKIDEFDMEEASRARRNFEEKYSIEKEKETKLHASVSCLSGVGVGEWAADVFFWFVVFTFAGRDHFVAVAVEELSEGYEGVQRYRPKVYRPVDQSQGESQYISLCSPLKPIISRCLTLRITISSCIRKR